MPRGSLTVDRRDPTPLHHQVRQGLVAYIRDNGLRPGDRLPPEPELYQRFGVSRQTLRQAVGALVHQNVLARQRPGGTFVAFGAIEGTLRSLRSIWDDLRQINLAPAASVLSAKVTSCDEETALTLRRPVGSPVFKLERLFTGNGEPVAVDLELFPLPEFDWLLHEDLSTSWYEVLETKRGIQLEYARQTLKAAAATRRQASHLGVPANFPLFEISRILYAQGGRLINCGRSWFRGDRYHLSLVLPRHADETARRSANATEQEVE